MRRFFHWLWATYETMSLAQWLIALPIWGVGASAMPIIGIIGGWPIWLLATVSAIMAFLWLTIITWIVRRYHFRKESVKGVEPIQTANATSDSAAATGSGTAATASESGQAIAIGHAGRDVIINPPLPTAVSRDERDFVKATPDDLIRFFRADQTSIQSSRTVEPFIGKWMKVEGHLSDVKAWPGDSADVTLEEYGLKASIQFSGKKWLDRLYLLNKGDRLTALGQIYAVNSVGVFLHNCELMEVQNDRTY